MGLSAISNIDECKSMMSYVRSFYPGIPNTVREKNDKNYPEGCYVFTNVWKICYGIWFNIHPSSAPRHDSRQICKQEENGK